MYDELGIGDVIDQAIPQDLSRRHVSIGQAVKAMVLNGLGFVNQRLYLFPDFFANKPLDKLFNGELSASQLNDDVMGRALDSIFEADPTTLFGQVSAQAVSRLKLDSPRFQHLDSTSFHVDGEYNSADEAEAGVIQITQGYSRDHRPDLNQVILNLIVENQSGIPLLMQAASGNSSDKTAFPQLVNAYVEQLQCPPSGYMVADSALYSEANLQAIQAVNWLTRVPETLNEVKAAIRQTEWSALKPLVDHYRYRTVESEYGGIKQRWLVIHSEHAQQRAIASADRTMLKGSEAELKSFNKLIRQPFACQADAQKMLDQFTAKLVYTTLESPQMIEGKQYAKAGRPSKSDIATACFYLGGTLASKRDYRASLIHQKSFFVIATNELDNERLSDLQLFQGYKGQQQVERGFRFLKDPMFLASSFFLKSPKRIMALLFVMTVCLLVYAALEHRIRRALKDNQATFPDQKKKPTQNPTARWVFQCFSGVHVLTLEETQHVLNLKPHLQLLVSLLGPSYEKNYS